MDSMGIFQYKKTGTGMTILACRSLDDTAVIPETIEGEPVTELAPYAFSQRRIPPADGEEEGLWTRPDSSFIEGGQWETLPLLCGERLKTVHLPGNLEKIGNYAFYNCYNLEHIICHSTLQDLGSGMFTGCNHIKKVGITVHPDKKSCMKELLSEIRQRIVLFYQSEEGSAKLIFPEFFEEAVENTPARILYTTTHGAGHRYRYCFSDTKFQFKEYDSLFVHEVARDTADQALELALCRLFYPLQLSDHARDEYLSYVRGHWKETAEMVMAKKEMSLVRSLLACMDMVAGGDISGELRCLVETAGHNGFTEAAAYLLEYMRTKFPVKRKDFTL